jgi:Family of unknown function (DUF6256)
MISAAEISVIVGYVLLMGFLAAGLTMLRRSAPGSDPRRLSRAAARPDRGWLRLARYWAATAVGGYVVLMAIIVIFYVATDYSKASILESTLSSAATGTALLVGISVPVFLGLSWLTQRWRQRADGQDGSGNPKRRRSPRPGRPA